MLCVYFFYCFGVGLGVGSSVRSSVGSGLGVLYRIFSKNILILELLRIFLLY